MCLKTYNLKMRIEEWLHGNFCRHRLVCILFVCLLYSYYWLGFNCSWTQKTIIIATICHLFTLQFSGSCSVNLNRVIWLVSTFIISLAAFFGVVHLGGFLLSWGEKELGISVGCWQGECSKGSERDGVAINSQVSSGIKVEGCEIE